MCTNKTKSGTKSWHIEQHLYVRANCTQPHSKYDILVHFTDYVLKMHTFTCIRPFKHYVGHKQGISHNLPNKMCAASPA